MLSKWRQFITDSLPILSRRASLSLGRRLLLRRRLGGTRRHGCRGVAARVVGGDGTKAADHVRREGEQGQVVGVERLDKGSGRGAAIGHLGGQRAHQEQEVAREKRPVGDEVVRRAGKALVPGRRERDGVQHEGARAAYEHAGQQNVRRDRFHNYFF